MSMSSRRAVAAIASCPVVVASFAGLAQARDCSWSIEPGPLAVATIDRIWDVVAPGPDDAHAVGYRTGTGAYGLHWDGTSWSAFAAPDVSGLPGPFPASGPDLQLTGIGLDEDGATWALGRMNSALPSFQIGWPVVMRWDGGGWHDLEQIDLGQTTYAIGGVIEGASHSPDGDVWGYGTKNAGAEAPGVANILTVRRHGGTWSNVPFPIGFSRINVVGDILAFAQDDAWLVGYGDSAGTPFYPIVAHWNGSTWSSVTTPIAGAAQHFPAAISGTGPNDLWIAGEKPGGVLLMHFDGEAWTVHDSPNASTARISQLAAQASDDVWAWSTTAGAFHFDGIDWQPAAIPTPPGATARGILEMKPNGDGSGLWAVGAWSDAAGNHALLERLTCTSGAPGDLDGDGLVGFADLLLLLADWGACPPAPAACPADLDGDDAVSFADLLVLLAAWN